MILLLSSSSDVSIDYVIAWLKHYKKQYLRINADEIISGGVRLELSNNRRDLFYKGKLVDVNNINAIWYRKFGGFTRSPYFHSAEKDINSDDLKQLGYEYCAILSAIIALFKHEKWLTLPWSTNLNKIDVLMMAEDCGLKVPKSFLVSTRNELEIVSEKILDGIISKSVYETCYIKDKKGVYSMFTKEIKKGGDLPEVFFPSFIQEKISKQYELRIFYIDKNFYTMSIFSQKNKLTELDFRKYDWQNPNRQIPYQLPSHIEKKLYNLFSKLGLNCCSVDMIKSEIDNEYYFLEINPTGEFGMVSHPCNFELYKQVANTLIKMDQS